MAKVTAKAEAPFDAVMFQHGDNGEHRLVLSNDDPIHFDCTWEEWDRRITERVNDWHEEVHRYQRDTGG